MRYVGRLLSAVTWLLVCGSVVVLVGGLFGRPLLLAAVPTGSMVPVLEIGDMIVVIPNWAVTHPGLDDIVIFKTPENKDWVVHRIIDGNPAEGFVTKGDANPVPDAPRVFQKDIVGVVPQLNGSALRLPRLGLLSVAQGPLSSPVVAGIALIMGVYLLVLDVRPGVRLPRLRMVQKSRANPTALLTMYAGLAATAFITTVLPAWALSSNQTVRYQVVEQKDLRFAKDTDYVVGRPHREVVTLTNPSPMPLVYLFQPEDPNIRYTRSWVTVPPGGKSLVEVIIETPTTGTFESVIRTGVFLPLLPGVVLSWVGGRSLALAVILTAAVPSALLMGIALMDERARFAMRRIRTRLTVRFL